MDQIDLFKKMSDRTKQIIMNTANGLHNWYYEKDTLPHVRSSIAEYYNQLKNLMDQEAEKENGRNNEGPSIV